MAQYRLCAPTIHDPVRMLTKLTLSPYYVRLPASFAGG